MPAIAPGAREPRKGPLPVTVLSGFLGAGKTTLLKRLLENSQGLRIAALVNDVGAVNIDGSMVSRMNQAEELIQLENGCICCTLRDSLMHSLLDMAENRAIDYCVVESTGVSEPRPVAETFTFKVDEAKDEDGNVVEDAPLSQFVRLDTCVTIVDAKNFPDTLKTKENVQERFGEEGEGADRDVAEILADQLEFADVVIVNKCDLVDEAQVEKVCNTIRAFNLGAQLIRTTQSNVPPTDVIGTNKFDLAKAVGDAVWYKEMSNESPKSELEEFGISTAVYRRRRPFHPKRFEMVADQLSGFGNALLRSKGFVWLATKNEGCGVWSQTGVVWSIVKGARWFCTIPREEWSSNDPEYVQSVEENMHSDPKIGDRRQELVFIGQHLDEKRIFELLDGCLLNDEEMEDETGWAGLTDPFEEWDFDAVDEEEVGGCGVAICPIEIEYCDDDDCEEDTEADSGEETEEESEEEIEENSEGRVSQSNGEKVTKDVKVSEADDGGIAEKSSTEISTEAVKD